MGSGCPTPRALSGRVEESFRRRLTPLPPETQQLLLVAAAEPVGDAELVWRAAERLGVGVDAAAPAAAAGLVEIGAQVRFRHPLVRYAGYRAASPAARQAAHRALAEVTDPDLIPTGVRGTARRRPTARTRTSPRSSSAPPAGRRRAAAWPRRPRSCSAPPS